MENAGCRSIICLGSSETRRSFADALQSIDARLLLTVKREGHQHLRPSSRHYSALYAPAVANCGILKADLLADTKDTVAHVLKLGVGPR
jgi:hypothetical protein